MGSSRLFHFGWKMEILLPLLLLLCSGEIEIEKDFKIVAEKMFSDNLQKFSQRLPMSTFPLWLGFKTEKIGIKIAGG